MTTVLIIFAIILGYSIPGLYAARGALNSAYEDWFREQKRNNAGRRLSNPDEKSYIRDKNGEYRILYQTRREWARRKDYALPDSWIVADYTAVDHGYTMSPADVDFLLSVLTFFIWPILAVAKVLKWIFTNRLSATAIEKTFGKAIEQTTYGKHKQQLEQSRRLSDKAKETLELADQFTDFPENTALLKDIAASMAEQAEELGKLNS